MPGEQARISVLVRPGATRNEVVSFVNGAWHVKVAAPPEKGKANRELIAFLSEALGLSKARVNILSGHTAVHHFVTIGTLAMLGGLTGVTHDVPPYMLMLIDHRTPRGVNIVGMQRNGLSGPEIDSVQRVWRMLYRGGLSKESVAKELEAAGLMTKAARNLLEFMRRSDTGKLGRYLEVTRQERGGVA